MKNKSFLKLTLKFTVIFVIIFFLGRSVLVNWEKVQAFNWSFDPVLMTLSCLIFFIAYAFLPWIWRKILYYMGYELNFGDAWDMYYIGNLGRYIPGKVWTIAGMAYMGGKVGIPAHIAGASAVFAQAYSLLSSFVFFVIFLIFNGAYFTRFRFLLIVPVVTCMAVVFIFPKNLKFVLNIVLRRLGKAPVNIGISTFSALKTVLFYCVSWVLFGCAFWCFVSAVAGSGKVDPFFAAGVYAIAYVTGFIAFFVPGGFGIREGMMVILLSNVMPVGVAVIIAGLSRLLVTIIEIAAVAVVLLRKGFFYGEKKTTEKK